MAKVKHKPKSKVYIGKDLDNLKSGVILQVVKTPKGSTCDLYRIVVTTDNKDYPVIDLGSGGLWHSILKEYEFLLIEGEIVLENDL